MKISITVSLLKTYLSETKIFLNYSYYNYDLLVLIFFKLIDKTTQIFLFGMMVKAPMNINITTAKSIDLASVCAFAAILRLSSSVNS